MERGRVTTSELTRKEKRRCRRKYDGARYRRCIRRQRRDG